MFLGAGKVHLGLKHHCVNEKMNSHINYLVVLISINQIFLASETVLKRALQVKLKIHVTTACTP